MATPEEALMRDGWSAAMTALPLDAGGAPQLRRGVTG
ncbi:hypothetical protein P3T20_005181 [Paraburkholderia sp. GAS206C]